MYIYIYSWNSLDSCNETLAKSCAKHDSGRKQLRKHVQRRKGNPSPPTENSVPGEMKTGLPLAIVSTTRRYNVATWLCGKQAECESNAWGLVAR